MPGRWCTQSLAATRCALPSSRIAYLASDAAAFVTGQAISVASGW